ncbi:unnamed protein product, partial [Medioppia subpectinata]
MAIWSNADHNLTPVQRLMSSCVGATVTSLCTTPLDVVKTRLQAQQKATLTVTKKPTVTSAVAKQASGHFGETFSARLPHWQDTSPEGRVMAIPGTVLYFTVYDELRESLCCRFRWSADKQPLWVPVVCGGAARTLTAVTVSPIEMIRTKLQSQRLTYGQTGRAIAALVRARGYRSLWRGLSATIARVVPFSCIYWASYETAKVQFNANPREPTFWVSFWCGAGAGTLASLLTTPFDVVKTHRQIDWSADGSSQRIDRILAAIYRSQGLRGLFAGATPRALREAPASAVMIGVFEVSKAALVIPGIGIYFTSYDMMRVHLCQRYGYGGSGQPSTPAWIPITAGGLSRTLAAVIFSPIEMVRTKMQSTHITYGEVGRAVRHMVATQGYRSLWTGLSATILRDAPFSSIYWLVYEKMKAGLNAPVEPPVAVSFVCGATAGTVSGLVTHPFDVVKTHRQTELGQTGHTTVGAKGSANRNPYKTSDILAIIYREKGLRGLFAGIWPRVMRIAPGCAIMITTFECGKTYFRRYNDRQVTIGKL